MTESFSIGDLTRAAGVKPTTIRCYETEELLSPPTRTAGGHRVYTRARPDGWASSGMYANPASRCPAVRNGWNWSPIRIRTAPRSNAAPASPICIGNMSPDHAVRPVDQPAPAVADIGFVSLRPYVASASGTARTATSGVRNRTKPVAAADTRISGVNCRSKTCS
jgi:MerR family regulatory protein